MTTATLTVPLQPTAPAFSWREAAAALKKGSLSRYLAAVVGDEVEADPLEVGLEKFAAGQLAEALPKLEQALAEQPFHQEARVAIAKCLRAAGRHAEALVHLEGSGAAVEETRRRLVEEVEPALERAERKLIRACKPFGVEDLSIAVPMVRHQAADAVTARLQRSLEAAEDEEGGIRQKLDARLAELGFDDGDVEARLGGFEWALSIAQERLQTRDHARPLAEVEADLARLEAEVRRESRPEWDASVGPADAEEPDAIALQARRDETHAAWTAAARLVPDVRRITDRHSAVERRVAVLEAGLEGAGVTGRVTTREVEPQLQARLAAVRRPGSHDETIPLLVDEALLRLDSEVKWSMLDMLERCAAQVQMVYLTDDPEVITWARRRVGADALSLLESSADVVL
jgi:tetratricopeptide (TPR) repeat protein